MALFDPNSSNTFFDSAMAELDNGYAPNLDVDDEEFADALEHQEQHGMSLEAELQDGEAFGGANNGTNACLPPAHNALAFENNNTYQPNSGQLPEIKQIYKPYARQDHFDPSTDLGESVNVNKTGASEKHAAAYRDVFKQPTQFPQVQHTLGCSGSRGASTPPATPPATPTPPSQSTPAHESDAKTTPTLQQRVWLGPDDLRDVAKPFLREKRWHERVVQYRPNAPLAPHRYWIGVLEPGRKPSNASKEEHFTWMKGNRLTTVETVRKVYEGTTMIEGVFMMGGERPKDQDRMEQLDLFNDKIVLFKVAVEGTPASVGRLITEGLVTKEAEVIELDD